VGEEQPLLSVDGMVVRYADGTEAVKDVSFAVGRAERVALVGESGSGKTTLALAVAGFLRAEGAQITSRGLVFDGRSMDRSATRVLPERTAGLSMVLQDAMTSLDPLWTVGNQLTGVIRTTSGGSKRAARTAAAEWLHRVGLHDVDRVLAARPYELSGGMRQRVMMAIALCGRPQLVVADEPTSALDASLARATMDLLVQLTEESGTSLLVVSHDLHLCLQYCDRVMVMYHGELVEQGPVDQVATRAQHPYTRGLLACVPTLETARLEELPTLESVAREHALTRKAG
jgi:ABC-type dipeptide/oligopeptide/nickel transport system ATPase component